MPHGEEFIPLRKQREELTGEEFNGGKIIGNRDLIVNLPPDWKNKNIMGVV